MQSYFDVVTDSGNRPIAGAQVFVYNYDGTLATLYGDQALLSTTVLTSDGTPYIVDQELLSPQSNPIVTGADGKFLFFAANGVYSVVITADNYDTRTLVATLNDPTPPTPSVSPYVTFALSSAAPNDTVNAVSMTPVAPTTNADLALVPKGNGAILAQVPDGATAGGNKRGIHAVDWQTLRAFSTDVASGDYSVVGGGYSNRASGTSSVVAGGSSNDATALTATVGGGGDNEATATGATVAGGSGNEATALYAFVGSGRFNIASGQYSAISGGYENTATGAYSTIAGGAYGSTRGIVGYHVFPACNGPIDTFPGLSQAGILILATQTTDATPTVIRSNQAAASTTNQIILPNNSAYYFKGTVIANVTGGGDTKSWTFDGQIKRGANAAATTLTGSTVTSPYEDAGASTWAVALSADTTNGGLAVTVTGQASTTIRWACKIETTEVSFS
jgi:hypothetical protein